MLIFNVFLLSLIIVGFITSILAGISVTSDILSDMYYESFFSKIVHLFFAVIVCTLTLFTAFMCIGFGYQIIKSIAKMIGAYNE